MPYEARPDELDALAGRAMQVALDRLRIRLDKRRADDLHEYLVGLGCEMAATYDPDVGQAFSTWFYRRARMRVVDWLRKTHGDSRHRGGPLAKLGLSYPDSLDAIAAAAPPSQLVVTDPERDSLTDAMVELGRDLSPDARWALVNVAGRIAEGATEPQAIREARNGLPYGETQRRLECLRSELAPVIAAPRRELQERHAATAFAGSSAVPPSASATT